MQHVSQIISQSQIPTRNTPSSKPNAVQTYNAWGTTFDPFAPDSPPPAEYINVADKLFDHFRMWFGAKVSDNTRYSTAAMIEWADYFARHNADIDELRQAFRLCQNLDFPPNNAADYLRLVRKNRHIDSHQAMHTAITIASQITAGNAVQWDNAAIYETALRIGFYTLCNEPSYLLTPRWDKAYKAVCDEMDAGATFTLPTLPALEHKSIPAPKDIADKFLSAVLKGLSKREVEQ